MAKKAVYNNQHLAIYITQDDFEMMLRAKMINVPVVIGKNPNGIGLLRVELQERVRDGLAIALDAERQAVQEVQDQFAKDHPNYESSSTTQTRRQRARKRVQRRPDDVD